MTEQTELLDSLIHPGLLSNPIYINDIVSFFFRRQERIFTIYLHPGITGRVELYTNSKVLLLTDFCKTIDDFRLLIDKLDELIPKLPPDKELNKPIRKNNADKQFAGRVIMLFNDVMGRSITLTDNYSTMICARVADGKALKQEIGLPQFEGVFKYIKKKWSGDEKMKQYLEIDTICRKSHFFKYLDQARDEARKNKKV